MPAQTAAQKLREKLAPFPMEVEGVQILVKRPDLRYMIYTSMIPTPLVAKVGTVLEQWLGKSLKNVADEAREGAEDAITLIDTLFCVAMVSPRVFKTQAEIDALSPEEQQNAMLLSEWEMDAKETILIAAMSRLETSRPTVAAREAAERFPGESGSDGAVSDVQGVRPEAVDSPGN